MNWFVRGDIDGFFGLALDNLVQLLLIDSLCGGVLGFPPEIVYGRVLPGAAVSILVGNLCYAVQARRLAERTGRTDVCALPYGINTVSLFAHVFLVMLPAKALATRQGLPDPARVAWQAGLLATLCSGIIELAAAFVAERVRKVTPRAALLSTPAGLQFPVPAVSVLLAAMAGGDLVPDLAVIVAMGLFIVLGALQDIESAEAAGGAYPARLSLLISGRGSVAAALCGSAFPMTI